MAIFDYLLKIAGKDNLHIDKRISKKYIARLCIKYGFMMLRGLFFSLGYPCIQNTVFIGKNVKVFEKGSLKIGNKVKIHDNSFIDALSLEQVVINNFVVLGRNTRIECTGSLSNLGKGLTIGERTTFGSDCFFGAAGGVKIGSDVIVGQFVRFHSQNHNFSDTNKLIREQGVSQLGIEIGDNCWIGAGAVFLDGAKLGNGCVVGANSVVTKCFPENSVIAGVPAKIIKFRGE